MIRHGGFITKILEALDAVHLIDGAKLLCNASADARAELDAIGSCSGSPKLGHTQFIRSSRFASVRSIQKTGEF